MSVIFYISVIWHLNEIVRVDEMKKVTYSIGRRRLLGDIFSDGIKII